MDINNVIRIPTSLDTNFFKVWFTFLKPYHNLTNREVDVVASFAKERYELQKVISDKKILDEVAMSEQTKAKVREECNLKLPHFQVIMSKLRSNKIIIDGRLNPKFLPTIKEGNKELNLLINFEL